MNKKLLRKKITEQKKRLSEEEINNISRKLTKSFLDLPEYREAECLFAYLPINQEIRTFDIVNKALYDGKMVALPRTKGDMMQFHFITSIDDCSPGFMKILEPDESMPSADDTEKKILMLMPGLAFDKDGGRLGYGKGHYDRYLSQHPQLDLVKVALCYDFQLVETVYEEEHDIRADRVLSAHFIKE